jgi:hypothetical protein
VFIITSGKQKHSNKRSLFRFGASAQISCLNYKPNLVKQQQEGLEQPLQKN